MIEARSLTRITAPASTTFAPDHQEYPLQTYPRLRLTGPTIRSTSAMDHSRPPETNTTQLFTQLVEQRKPPISAMVMSDIFHGKLMPLLLHKAGGIVKTQGHQ